MPPLAHCSLGISPDLGSLGRGAESHTVVDGLSLESQASIITRLYPSKTHLIRQEPTMPSSLRAKHIERRKGLMWLERHTESVDGDVVDRQKYGSRALKQRGCGRRLAPKESCWQLHEIMSVSKCC